MKRILSAFCFVAASAASAPASSDAFALLQTLDPASRDIVDIACSAARLGGLPNEYDTCVRRQIEELSAEGGLPDLSGVSSLGREIIELACEADRYTGGAVAYAQCLKSQIADLDRLGGLPDLSGIDALGRELVENACASERFAGGAVGYAQCLDRELVEYSAVGGLPDLGGYDREERELLESACLSERTLDGPAAYAECLRLEIARYDASGGLPNLSEIDPSLRASFRNICRSARFLDGAGGYATCLREQLADLPVTVGASTLAALDDQTRRIVEEACLIARFSVEVGAYDECLARELALLGQPVEPAPSGDGAADDGGDAMAAAIAATPMREVPVNQLGGDQVRTSEPPRVGAFVAASPTQQALPSQAFESAAVAASTTPPAPAGTVGAVGAPAFSASSPAQVGWTEATPSADGVEDPQAVTLFDRRAAARLSSPPSGSAVRPEDTARREALATAPDAPDISREAAPDPRRAPAAPAAPLNASPNVGLTSDVAQAQTAFSDVGAPAPIAAPPSAVADAPGIGGAPTSDQRLTISDLATPETAARVAAPSIGRQASADVALQSTPQSSPQAAPLTASLSPPRTFSTSPAPAAPTPSATPQPPDAAARGQSLSTAPFAAALETPPATSGADAAPAIADTPAAETETALLSPPPLSLPGPEAIEPGPAPAAQNPDWREFATARAPRPTPRPTALQPGDFGDAIDERAPEAGAEREQAPAAGPDDLDFSPAPAPAPRRRPTREEAVVEAERPLLLPEWLGGNDFTSSDERPEAPAELETTSRPPHVSSDGLLLLGILSGGARDRALIGTVDGGASRVERGDDIAGWRVIDIGEDFIRLERGREVEDLKLP